MKWIAFIVFGLALVTVGPAFAETPAAEGTVQIVSIPSPSLERAQLAPSSTQQAAVYLPPSYASSKKRYPVVYFLPGYTKKVSDFVSTANGGNFELKAVMDRQIGSGKVREMIVVVTSGATPLGGGFYVNSAVNGNWEDYIVKDLVSFVDGKYRTLAVRRSRGIAGQSMGGFGALQLATRHPEVYGATYAMSPGVAAPDGMKTHPAFGPEPSAAVQAIQASVAGLDRTAALKELVAQADKLDPKVRAARFAIAYSLVFAPTNDAHLFEFPFPSSDPAGDARVWKLYDTGFGDWDSKVRENATGLKTLSITIDVGDHDHYVFIREGCRYLDELLTAAGIKHKYDVYPGDHSDKVAERLENSVLPTMSAVLAQ